MASKRFERTAELFESARQLEGDEREAFVRKCCGDDGDLHEELRALLDQHDRATVSLDESPSSGFGLSAVFARSESEALDLDTPVSIGRYRIVRKIAEGGMGIVYLAEQDQPRRNVALKVIKPGMDSRAVIARFEQERQALAIIDHPNVSKVLDAGTTERGLPYFVMEYMDGEPITDYCKKHRLNIEQRLELFIRVCEAVQHAHMKGVIHRDLKPSNILVASGTPKIIDFGIAKALNQRLTEETIFTERGQLIGTPEYMSPEQADVGPGAHADIDTRADIYSLGAILYELLTGSAPLDSLSPPLRQRTFTEIHRTIREVDPPRPSARSNGVRDDLDWIVMRCLEKDRDRRYETASALATDLRRYLSEEPVAARPPSVLYVARKFARRNRALVGGTGLAAAFMLASVAGTSIGLLRARAAEAEVRKSAEELQQVVEFQAAQLQGINVPLMGVHMRLDLLERAREGLGRRALAEAEIEHQLHLMESIFAGVNFTDAALAVLDENILKRAVETADEQFGNQPLVLAQLLGTLGEAYRELGLLSQAEEPLMQALAIRREHLETDHPDVMRSERALGDLLRRQGRYDEAEAHFVRALAGFRRALSEDHEETLRLRGDLAALLEHQGNYEEAQRHLDEVLERAHRVLGPDHPLVIALNHNAGSLLNKQGRYSGAETFLAAALQASVRVHGEDHPSTLTVMHSLGSILERQGKFDEAVHLYRTVLDARQRHLGDVHPHTLLALNSMGYVLESQGMLDEAIPYYEQALEASRLVHGERHPTTLMLMNNLGMVLRELGRYDGAQPHLTAALDGFQTLLGDDHPSTLTLMNNVGLILNDLGRYDDAHTHYRAALDGRKRVQGEDHPATLVVLNNLGSLRMKIGDMEGARLYWEESLEKRRRVHGDDHPSTLLAISQMGMLLRQLGELEEAERLGAEAVDRARGVLADDHWRVGLYLGEYGKTLTALGQFEEAEERLLQAERILIATFGADHPQSASVKEAIAELHAKTALPDAAKR